MCWLKRGGGIKWVCIDSLIWRELARYKILSGILRRFISLLIFLRYHWKFGQDHLMSPWVAGSELIPVWAYQLYFMYLIFVAYKSLNCCPSLNIVSPGSAGIWAVAWGKRDPVLSWRSQQEEFYSFHCYQWGADLPLNFSVICLSCQVSSSFFDCDRLFHLFTAIFLSP